MQRSHKTPTALVAIAAAAALSALSPRLAAAAEVIELTQVPCQFLESEADHGFTAQKPDDCKAINAKTADERLAAAKVLDLKAGDYVFRVTNRNVPYELGFWIRDSDYDWRNPIHKLTKTSVSGGGLTEGMTHDYEVTLKPGEYLFSCPLNPTPDYTVRVSAE